MAIAEPKKSDPRVQTLRQLFRHLHAFRAIFESDNVSEIRDPDGITWSIWDLEQLYEVAVNTDLLPLRQRQAIELFLVLNMPEDKVAEALSIKSSNPVGMYATSGLVRLLKEMDLGHIINPWAQEEFYD